MSKALLLQSKVKPELIHRVVMRNRSVEVWTTPCIVGNFQCTDPSVLINPANPQLSGVKNFPYFPRGGPVPERNVKSMHRDWQPLGFVSQWGGMEVGSGMLYPVSVVDGLVHQWGGWKLQAECGAKALWAGGGDACPVGDAVVTSAGSGHLNKYYDTIVHTAPPFFKYYEGGDDPCEALHSCYRNALKLASQYGDRIATPLLGAGARGFPTVEATRVAGAATKEWCTEGAGRQQVVLFGLLERGDAEQLAYVLEETN